MLEEKSGRPCGPMERGPHTGAGLLGGLLILWGTLSVPMGGTCAETGHAELQPKKYTGEIFGVLSSVGGSHAGGGAEESTPLRKKE